MKFVTVLTVALFALLYASQADAQNFTLGGNGLDISASTLNPIPGQSVTITVRGYGININSANVTWLVDGKAAGKGVGLTSISVTAPAAGKKMTVSVTAVAPDGLSANNVITIGSGSVDLIIESNGYVPPFFLGKTPIAYQNSVNITAVPHLSNSSGTEYDPKSLVYQWKQSSSALQDQSGYGAQSITLAGALIPKPYMVTVNVSTRDGNAQTSGSISVNPSSPEVLFYRNDPLYGPMFNNALGDNIYLGSQRETGVLAVPFGFNMTNLGASGLSFDWLINNISHPELSSNRSITLRAPDDKAGSSDISLTVHNAKDILQQAQLGFSAIWGITNSNSSSKSVTF